ncbi:MAG: ABC transporter ATP-binding protein [Rhodospirillaceae bacterium]|nr:ABC transporter ATP-binding protein [Rhodospirillaceae bacterium]
MRAVDGVSLAVGAGEILTIIGPNGAGKTTVFNLISRIFDATAGRIRFDGHDITRMRPHRLAGLGIARTFQNLELFDSSTVLENLLLGRHVHRRTNLVENFLFLPKARRAEIEDRRAAEEVIDLFGLAPHAETPIGSLSYGLRKIVELARALCIRPRLLMLDEPSSGLGAEETETMARWIGDLRRRLGLAVVMIEHDMSLVNAVSDRVVALNQGRIIAEGSAAAVQNDPEVIRAYLGG